MPAPELYYYSRLGKYEQLVYYAMRKGLEELAPVFPVPAADIKQMTDIYFCLRLDHPELFYATHFSYRKCPAADTVEFQPDYLFEKKKVLEHRKAVSARVQKLAAAAEKLDEAGRLQYIHDFICGNVRYDKLKKDYSHEIIGPLTQGVGVCEGIAKSVKVLCDRLSIPCIIALSDSNPEKGIKYRHAWNLVRLSGRWYHLDATFDNSLGSPDAVRYDYYLRSDAQFFRDHEPVMMPVPACPSDDLFYYKAKKLSFTKEEEVEKRALQAAKKGKTLLFHWRGSYLTREQLKRLLEILETAAKQNGTSPAVSLNWPQAVLEVHFSREAPAEELTLQEANEGEQS